MKEEQLIKSPDRVKDVGEVFTPKRIVALMLDQPEITAKINDLSATFLDVMTLGLIQYWERCA